MVEKKTLRKEMRQKRNSLSSDQRERAAKDCLTRLRELPAYQEARWLYVYVSYLSELPTGQLIEAALKDSKQVAVPKVMGDIMRFYQITGLADLVSGAYGILEPKGDTPEVTMPGLMLLPGLAFDKKGYRMGYGGGFYDKYLSSHQSLITYALGYDIQLIPEVPHEDHDVVLDGLLLGKTDLI